MRLFMPAHPTYIYGLMLPPSACHACMQRKPVQIQISPVSLSGLEQILNDAAASSAASAAAAAAAEAFQAAQSSKDGDPSLAISGEAGAQGQGRSAQAAGSRSGSTSPQKKPLGDLKAPQAEEEAVEAIKLVSPSRQQGAESPVLHRFMALNER